MLTEEINRYVALRRSLGFKLKETTKNLALFGQFADFVRLGQRFRAIAGACFTASRAAISRSRAG